MYPKSLMSLRNKAVMRNRQEMPLQGELQSMESLGNSMAIDWLYGITWGLLVTAMEVQAKSITLLSWFMFMFIVIGFCANFVEILGSTIYGAAWSILTLYRRSVDCFTQRPSPYRAVNTFHLGYKNQSVYAVNGTSRCLFSDKYKTHKYSVGRAYNCWMLNCWCITWPAGFKRLIYLVTNQQKHIDKICFIINYYLPTRVGRFCDHNQGVTQEYKQYINKYTKCIFETTGCYSQYSKRPLWSQHVQLCYF